MCDGMIDWARVPNERQDCDRKIGRSAQRQLSTAVLVNYVAQVHRELLAKVLRHLAEDAVLVQHRALQKHRNERRTSNRRTSNRRQCTNSCVCRDWHDGDHAHAAFGVPGFAVDEAVILLLPPLPLVIESECCAVLCVCYNIMCAMLCCVVRVLCCAVRVLCVCCTAKHSCAVRRPIGRIAHTLATKCALKYDRILRVSPGGT